MKRLIATAAFLLLAACMQDGGSTAADMRYAPSNDGCVRAGCNGSLCMEADESANLATTCAISVETQCYHNHGECRRLDTGNCGWAPSYHLQQCLANPGQYLGAGAAAGPMEGPQVAPGIGSPTTSPGISGSVR